MVPIAIVLGVLAAAFAWFGLMRRGRDRAMLSLASELRFEYMDRTLPESFPRTEEQFNKIRQVWNVIHGQQKATEIIVFDGIFGDGRGVYRTFIAARTPSDPFPRDEGLLGNTLQSSEWAVLCGEQRALNLIPWSMSTRRIQEYLRTLKL